MRPEELIISLYRIGAIRFGDFTLKSGRNSSVYLDVRRIISFPNLLRAAASSLWESLDKRAKTVTHLCGVPYTALPIATCLSLSQEIPMVLRRKEQKTWGMGKTIEGVFKTDDRCLIIEDLITSGSSILETVADLRTAGFTVTDAAFLIDREAGGMQALLEAGIQGHAVFTMTQLLNFLLDLPDLPDKERALIVSYEQG